MFTKNRALIQATALPTLLCVFCIAGSFLPWFEYRAIWDPPKVISHGEFAANPVHERLWLLSFGPYAFEELTDSQGTDGCYVVGMCGTCTTPVWPNRLHVSKLTESQRVWVQWIRVVGILAAAVNLVVGVGSFVELIIFSWHRYGPRLTMVVLGIVVVAICFGVLQLIGAFIGDVFNFDEQVPTECVQTRPESQECLGFPNIVYALPNGTVSWEFGQVLPIGPGLEGLGLALRCLLLVIRCRRKQQAWEVAT